MKNQYKDRKNRDSENQRQHETETGRETEI